MTDSIPAPATPPPGPQVPPYMDQRQAARYLSLSVKALRELIAKRAIAYVPISERRIRFRKCDLDRFMDSRVVRAAQ